VISTGEGEFELHSSWLVPKHAKDNPGITGGRTEQNVSTMRMRAMATVGRVVW
jgi:hypothetical protein